MRRRAAFRPQLPLCSCLFAACSLARTQHPSPQPSRRPHRRCLPLPQLPRHPRRLNSVPHQRAHRPRALLPQPAARPRLHGDPGARPHQTRGRGAAVGADAAHQQPPALGGAAAADATRARTQTAEWGRAGLGYALRQAAVPTAVLPVNKADAVALKRGIGSVMAVAATLAEHLRVLPCMGGRIVYLLY